MSPRKMVESTGHFSIGEPDKGAVSVAEPLRLAELVYEGGHLGW